MVYVSNDGTVYSTPPWSFRRVLQLFYGLFAFVIYFFKSLVGLDVSSGKSRSSSGSSFRDFRGSGGGGGPFGPGGGGGGGPSRRIRTIGDINPPTVNAGGCPGGSCGM